MRARALPSVCSLTLVSLLVAGWQDPVAAPIATSAAPSPPAVGAPAPTFRLNDHLGSAVAVGAASERWTVVAFYPKAATPG